MGSDSIDCSLQSQTIISTYEINWEFCRKLIWVWVLTVPFLGKIGIMLIGTNRRRTYTERLR
jgi:hypothetical protein